MRTGNVLSKIFKRKKMKATYIKCIWLALLMPPAFTVNAQSATGGTAYNTKDYSNYDRISEDNGKRVEEISFYRNDKKYEATLVDDKMTELYIEDKKIPAADWGKYSDVIAAIREQIRLNKIQAAKNAEQAKRNEEQAKKNEAQARLNEIQEQKN